MWNSKKECIIAIAGIIKDFLSKPKRSIVFIIDVQRNIGKKTLKQLFASEETIVESRKPSFTHEEPMQPAVASSDMAVAAA